MNNPKISVIVPVYNVEKYIHRCVDSILTQTFTDFEVLLIDDGSTDRSGEICDEYRKVDVRVRVFHQENGGVSKARNVGLENANGEWVTFVDSDDYVKDIWLSTFMGECVGYDVVISGFNSVYSDKHETFVISLDSNNPIKIADVLNSYNNFGFLWCKCFNRTIIEEHGIRFDEALSFLEDENFICCYWKFISKAKVINVSTYIYYAPNFENKYGDVDCFDAYFNLLNNYNQIIKKKNSFSLQKYSICCYRYMLLSYRKRKYDEGENRLKALSFLDNKKNLPIRIKLLKPWNYRFWHLFLIIYTLKGRQCQ